MTYTATTFGITYTVRNKTYTLDGYDATTGLTINMVNMSGWGLPAITPIVNRGAQQDGDTQVGYRLDARTFTLSLFVDNDNYFDYLRCRETLASMFAPSMSKGTIALTYTATNGGITQTIRRSIDGYIVGGLSFDDDVSNGWFVLANVQFRADDPTFYDPTPNSVTATATITGDATPIPKTYPVPYGSDVINQQTVVNYSGSYSTYPIITINTGLHGFTSMTITNLTTGKSLSFANLDANNIYTVDLRYGFKTIVDQNGNNAFEKVVAGSNLASFNIADSRTVNDGINVIYVDAILGNPSIPTVGSGESVVISYFNRYSGI